MANTSSRALRLLSLLQSHRYWAGTELADRLEISLRTLRRDVDRLRELGYPVTAQRGVDGGYQLEAGATMPPLVLDDEEAVALAVGLLSTAGSPLAGTAEASARALAKVVPVMPRRLRRRVEAVTAMTEQAGPPSALPAIDPAALSTAALACRDSERLRFGYAAADGVRTERLVEPHRMVSLGRRWYLVAYDLDRHGWRTFRLDRVGTVTPTGARFAPRRLPAADAATMVNEAFAHRATRVEVTALVQAPAPQVTARVGRWARVEAMDEQSSLLRMNVDSLDWAALALGSLGAQFTVREPPELLQVLHEWGQRFAAATTSAATPDDQAHRPPQEGRGA